MAKITYIVEQYGACAWYRCHTPGMALHERGHDVELGHAPADGRLAETDVYVFQRPSRPASLELIRVANERGGMTVVEMDDDYWNLHPSNPAYGAWKDTPAVKVLEECTRLAQVVTVSTKELAEVIRPVNRNVRVLENVLPTQHWPDAPKPVSREGQVVVGWAGGHAHYPDLQLLSGTVESLLARYENLVVAVAGMEKVPFRPHERLRFFKATKIEEYPQLLSRFDIGLAPVVDSRFNRCKSDLKFVEYSMIGIPSVASRIATYERTVTHGENGFLARNPKDWLKHVSRLIESPELREEVGLRARALAEARTIERTVWQWEEAYGLR